MAAFWIMIGIFLCLALLVISVGDEPSLATMLFNYLNKKLDAEYGTSKEKYIDLGKAGMLSTQIDIVSLAPYNSTVCSREYRIDISFAEENNVHSMSFTYDTEDGRNADIDRIKTTFKQRGWVTEK